MSDVSLKQVYEEIRRVEENMVTKKDIQALVDTLEILSNPETLRQIAESDLDIKAGRTKKITSAQDLLAEM